MITASITLASFGFALSLASGIVAYVSGIRPAPEEGLYTTPKNGIIQLLLSGGVASVALAGALVGIAVA